MNKTRLLLAYFINTASETSFILKTIFFTFVFTFLSAFLINFTNIINFSFSNYSLAAKVNIIFKLLTGVFNTISTQDAVMILVISLLFGINLSLVIEKINFIRKQKNLKITLGAGLISIASSGCASCGLSIVSLLGLGSVLAILPFGGFELYVFAALILLASIIYNLNSIYKACNL